MFGRCIVIQKDEHRLKLEDKVSRGRIYAREGGGADGSEEKETKIQLYGKIEKLFVESAKDFQGNEGDAGNWVQVEGCWVLRPTVKESVAVVHFIGGAFVGAAPQLTYRLFLQSLAERGLTVIATPFASGFDHSRIADEAQFRFERCLRALNNGQMGRLPVFGVGHSLGALTHVLIGSKYAVERQGNVLLSFNNKEVTAAIPLFSPAIVPMAQRFVPIIQTLTTLPAFQMGAGIAWQQFKNLNPPFISDILPLLEQLPPLYQDLADGKDQFVPSPAETDRLARAYYGVKPNLLVRFDNDSIDESNQLAEVLRQSSNLKASDIEVLTLSGDHARPLQQIIPEVPQAMADTISQGGAFFANLAAGSPLAEAAKKFGQSFSPGFEAQKLRESIEEDIESLVDEIAPWMGASRRPIGVRGWISN